MWYNTVIICWGVGEMYTTEDLFKDGKVFSFLKYFISNTVYEINNEYHMSFIKFVFRSDDLELIENRLDMDNYRIRSGINILKRNIIEYKNNDDEDTIYIKIDDCYKFFFLLNRIYEKMKVANKKENAKDIIRSIWLRMGVEDIDHINLFLEKQLNFLYGDGLFNGIYKVFKNYDNYKLVYDDNTNDDCFETNNYIELSLINKDYNNIGKEKEKYSFPVVHYAINYEDGNPICYVYGIQSLNEQRKDESIKEVLKEYKKKLRNGKVSPEFVLTLKLFIDVIESYGVTDIRVPLLQVFNYPYHEYLSKAISKDFSNYTTKEKELYEEMYQTGAYSIGLIEYLYTKSSYERFVDKEDIISKNKTERLIDTFMIMEEKYNNIEFLNEPFIEGDTLLIKIKEKNVTNKLVK